MDFQVIAIVGIGQVKRGGAVHGTPKVVDAVDDMRVDGQTVAAVFKMGFGFNDPNRHVEVVAFQLALFNVKLPSNGA